MDALVLPFLLAAVAEIGSPGQVLAMALHRRFGRLGAILSGIAGAALLTAAVAAAAGAALGPLMPARARGMLLGVALLLIGFGRLRAAKPADHAGDWRRLGALAASVVSFAVLAFGGEVQLAVAALTAAGRSAWLVAPAAAAGMTVGCALPLATPALAPAAPLASRLRWAIAALCLLVGAVLVLGALQLI